MNTKSLLIALAVIVVGGGAYFLSKSMSEPVNTPALTAENQSTGIQFSFSNPKKSAHYESNTPAHEAILAAAPVNVVLDFNFDLAAPSSISVTKDGVEYATGDLVVDSNKLSMRRNFRTDAPDGLYKVTYNACWPDRSCHDGHFEFAIDRSLAATYENLTGRSEVTVRMSEIIFKPRNIKVSPGTKITWINDEAVEHYVNTDSHPAHTYYPAQNSQALKRGESYSATFTTPGAYPYHCSAHAGVMVGNIIVL